MRNDFVWLFSSKIFLPVNIEAFSSGSLANALSNKYTKSEVIETKNHFKYFLEYLGEHGLNAQSIIVEDEYINKDFLQDYAAYYAFCFEKYPKFCKRVHFLTPLLQKSYCNG